MIRKCGFGLAVGAAFVVAACGRQVTPNPPGLGPGGTPVGFMSVKFDVAGQLNFSSYQYWIVFDTSGNGLTPDTHPFQNNWAGYSAAIEVGGVGGGTSANTVQFIKNSNPAIPPHFQYLIVPGQQLQYTVNSNGTGTEFTVVFQRVIFNPAPFVSPAPPFANVWRFNAFTTQASPQGQLLFVDSMGAGGANDPQWNSPALLVTAPTPPPPDPTPPPAFDTVFTALSSGQQIDPAAQIMSIEIANNP